MSTEDKKNTTNTSLLTVVYCIIIQIYTYTETTESKNQYQQIKANMNMSKTICVIKTKYTTACDYLFNWF